MREDFAMLILSHGRPDNIPTIQSLRDAGYTGKFYIIIDDEDDMQDEYFDKYGSKVIMFSKSEMEDKVDRGDNFNNRRIVLYARNKAFEIAENLGLEYFMVVDDDYTNFRYRFDDKLNFNSTPIKDLDNILNQLIKLYNKTGAKTIAFAQGGDYIGGENGYMGEAIRMKRKAMNTFLCKTDNPFYFMGSINEDANMYVRRGQLGDLIFTVNSISIDQRATQSNDGGLTDIYLQEGTYIKSFYTILYSPSSVKLRKMGGSHKRIHHFIRWKNSIPKIISGKYKKG